MQQATVVAPAPAPDVNVSRLAELRARASELEMRMRTSELLQQELRAQHNGAEGWQRQELEQRLSVARDGFVEAKVGLAVTNEQIRKLGADPVQPEAITVQPPPIQDPFLGPKEITTVFTGGVLLLFPLVLVLARRLWVRGSRREAVDLENSPRLQRIEQAVESIAVEVERIGEAQRFTTKLLADRQGDAAARMQAVPRREPGTITPH